MANAMKKLKLLHHLTAASASHPPPHPVATPQQPHASQQFPTPPASPVSPQTSPIRHLYHPTQAHAHYTDVLRSARAALHTLHTNQPSFTNTAHPPPPPPPTAPANMPGASQCLLPGGFMVLTPANSYDNTPGICVPASPPPPPQNMSINRPVELLSAVPRGNTTIYSSRPPPGSSPKSGSYYQRSRSPPKPRQRLSKEAVAKIGKDSRLARWERVLGYVRDQRNATLGSQMEGISGTSPSKLDRKRRAEEIATIEARNAVLDNIDIEEQDNRSLWSGGSGGTNGVDEFVWSEDEDDDILPMPTGPPPKKVFPEEVAEECEGIFEMQVDDDVMMPPTRTSTPQSMKRPRPRSTPDELAFQKTPWGKRIVEEMPALCREADLEGGLSRLVGRRMSAAY